MTIIVREVNGQTVVSNDVGTAISDALLPQVAAAQTAQGLSEAARDAAVTAEIGAQAAEVVATAQAANALAAAEASGAIQFFPTKAAANAALSGLANGVVVEVLADESVSGDRTRYQVDTGAYALKLNLSPPFVTPEQFYSAAHVDDTQSLISAIAAATPGVLELRRGKTYNVSGQILLPSNLTIRGNGAIINVNAGNWTGAITRFYALFTTVNVPARPLTILWRLGTGTIAYENIIIEDLTIQLNRDGAVLTSGQMLVSDFNAVRFEDARACELRRVRIIDEMTIGNNNGTHAVFFVRSRGCKYLDCYSENVTPITALESSNCVFQGYDIYASVGTCIETLAGSGHYVGKGYIDEVWWDVSTIGINSQSCIINGPVLGESALSGLTLGHATTGPDFYNVDQTASYSKVSDFNVLAGGTTHADHGYNGILIQNGSYIWIGGASRILGLRKKAAYTDRTGGIMIQPDLASDCVGITIDDGVVIDGATNGICAVKFDLLTVGKVTINDTRCAFYSETTATAPTVDFEGTVFSDCDLGPVILNGRVSATKVKMRDITGAWFTAARGYFDFTKCDLEEFAEAAFLIAKSLKIVDSDFRNASPITRVAYIDNSLTADTATIDQIEVRGNRRSGASNMLQLRDVLGQVDNIYVETTQPIRQRGPAYNFAGTPTTDGDYGPELVANGDFASATGWTTGTGWAIGSGVATYTAATANSGLTRTTAAAAVAGQLVLKYTVTANTLNAGSLRIGGLSGNSVYGSTFLALSSTVGEHRIVLTAVPVGTANTFDLWVNAAATTGAITIDDVSLKQVGKWVLDDASDTWNNAGVMTFARIT